MKQPARIKFIYNSAKYEHGMLNKNRHKKYSTSKLERNFAINYLDKLGLLYIYQYEVKEIGRFYDFAITLYTDKEYLFENKDGIDCIKQDKQLFIPSLLIEVDGDYFHANPKFYNKNNMNYMQKHNKRIDSLKDEWAGMHGIPLLRIWEDDIKNNSKYVMDEILKHISIRKPKKYCINY